MKIVVFQEDVFNPSYLAALYLKNLDFQKKVYVLGTKGITQELDDVGIRHLGVGVGFKLIYNSPHSVP